MAYYGPYRPLTLKDEAIKQQWLEKQRRDDEWLRLITDGSPEAMAKAREMEEEDKRACEQRQEQIDRTLRAMKAAEEQQAKAATDTAKALADGKVLKRMGDYRQLYFYRKSKVIFDLTYLFVERHITEYHDRTKDRMLQAARSGKQNFVEGMQDGQANLEQALYLVTIGQGSLQELQEDYEDYLRTRGLTLWDENHPRYCALVEFCKTRNDLEEYTAWIPKLGAEEMANLALTLIHQTDVLVEGFLRNLERRFIESGGAQETMRNIRALKRIH